MITGNTTAGCPRHPHPGIAGDMLGAPSTRLDQHGNTCLFNQFSYCIEFPQSSAEKAAEQN